MPTFGGAGDVLDLAGVAGGTTVRLDGAGTGGVRDLATLNGVASDLLTIATADGGAVVAYGTVA